jgi:peptide/nickel transport system permease protein
VSDQATVDERPTTAHRRAQGSGLTGFIFRRVFWGLVTLLLVVTLAFFLVNLLLPYDYAVTLGQRPRAIEMIRQQLGLDRPLVVQWLDYMAHFVRGDLGSTYAGTSVWGVVWQVLPTTVGIFAVGGIVAFLLGEWLGRVVAWTRRRVVATTTSIVSVLLFTAFPPWLVFLLTYFGGSHLTSLRESLGLRAVPGDQPEGLIPVLAGGLVVALLAALILRTLARRQRMRILRFASLPLAIAGFLVGLFFLGIWTEAIDWLLWPSAVVATIALILIAFGETLLVMSAGMSAEMPEDYVFTARAMGVPEHRVRDRHAAPNAVLPAISRLVTSMPYLIAGLVMIEYATGTYGLGSLFFSSIETGEIPTILGILAVIGILGIVMRMVLDVVQAVIDPRLRERESA